MYPDFMVLTVKERLVRTRVTWFLFGVAFGIAARTLVEGYGYG